MFTKSLSLSQVLQMLIQTLSLQASCDDRRHESAERYVECPLKYSLRAITEVDLGIDFRDYTSRTLQ